MSDKVKLTPKGFQKLKDELEYLSTTGRDEISQFMSDVMSEGDISENSGYDDARQKMGALETRIFELETLLSRAEIVEENAMEQVNLGATVSIDPPLGRHSEFTIVSTHEVDLVSGRVSDQSPIGVALMGKKVGDKGTVNGRSFKVAQIRFD